LENQPRAATLCVAKAEAGRTGTSLHLASQSSRSGMLLETPLRGAPRIYRENPKSGGRISEGTTSFTPSSARATTILPGYQVARTKQEATPPATGHGTVLHSFSQAK